MTAKVVSGKYVREFLKARTDKVVEHGKKVEGVTPNDLFKNINGRGRLHPENIVLFKRLTKGKYAYGVGVNDSKRVTLKGPKGKTYTVDAADIRKFAGAEGKRGRLSNEAKAEFVKTLVSS